MSDHTVCDKCGKIIDKSESWLQVVATELTSSTDGNPFVASTGATYDYHPEHAPKLTKLEPPEPAAPEETS
jgi:hypothetical protein